MQLPSFIRPGQHPPWCDPRWCEYLGTPGEWDHSTVPRWAHQPDPEQSRAWLTGRVVRYDGGGGHGEIGTPRLQVDITDEEGELAVFQTFTGDDLRALAAQFTADAAMLDDTSAGS